MALHLIYRSRVPQVHTELPDTVRLVIASLLHTVHGSEDLVLMLVRQAL